MKKVLMTLMAAVLCLSVAGCSGDKNSADAFQMYLDMQKNLEEVTSMEMSMTGTISLSADGETMNETMGADIKYIEHSETDIDMEMTMNAMGQEITMYYTDSYIYMDMMGYKVKYAADPEELLDQANMDFEITEEAVKNSSLSDISGGKKISFTLSEEFANETMAGMVDDMVAGMGLTGMDISFGDFICEVEVDNDAYPQKMSLVYSATIEYEGEKAEVSYDMEFTYKDLNSVSSINFPADLDDYMEVEM